MTNDSMSQDSQNEIATQVELEQKPKEVSVGVKPAEAEFVSRNRTNLGNARKLYYQRCKDLKNLISQAKDIDEVTSLKIELNSILKELSDIQFRYGKLGKLAGLRILNLRRENSRFKVETAKPEGLKIQPAVSVIKTIETPEGIIILYSDKTTQLIPKPDPISTTGPLGNELKTQNPEGPI